MPRARNRENEGLPARWKFEHGTYFFRVPPGQEASWDGKKKFALGKTLPDAYKRYGERMASPGEIRTVAELLDRYVLQVVPTKRSPKTRTENLRHIRKLRRILGHNGLTSIKPKHVYLYHDAAEAKVAAKRELEVLSHAYTKAVEWGLIDRHPFKSEVRLTGEKPRTRYIEDWELLEMLSLKPLRARRDAVLAVQAYIKLKLLTPLRQGDLLQLRLTDLKEDGIHITPSKTEHSTGKRQVFEWTPALRAAVDEAKAARPVHISPWLFCTGKGESYFDEEVGEARGWKSIWQRYKARVLAETKITEPFTEHDLRAKAGSDATSLEHAQQLLAHADSRTTKRIYRRKPERVKPAQ